MSELLNSGLAVRVAKLEAEVERLTAEVAWQEERHKNNTASWSAEVKALAVEVERLRGALEGYDCTCETEATEGWMAKVYTCPRCAAIEGAARWGGS